MKILAMGSLPISLAALVLTLSLALGCDDETGSEGSDSGGATDTGSGATDGDGDTIDTGADTARVDGEELDGVVDIDEDTETTGDVDDAANPDAPEDSPAELGDADGDNADAPDDSAYDADGVFIPRDDHSHVVASEGDVGLYTTVGLVDDRPAIVYYDATEGDLMFAHARHESPMATTDWDIHAIDTDGDVGQHAAAVIDYRGVFVAYYDATDGDLKFARATEDVPDAPADWHLSTVETDGDVGHFPAIVRYFDSLGIAYYDVDDQELHLAVTDTLVPTSGADWDVHVVDSDGDVGQHTSLVMHTRGIGGPLTAYMSYYDVTNGDLKYADGDVTLDAPEWEPETVDSDGDVGQHSLFVEGHEIVYYDATNGDLKLAYEDRDGWTFEIVDDEGDVGQYPATALESGRELLLYHDVTNGDLKITHRGISPYDRRWYRSSSIGVVDSEGEVGQHGSIAYGSCYRSSVSGLGGTQGRAAHYDATNGDLRFSYTGLSNRTWFAALVEPSVVDYGVVANVGGQPAIVYAARVDTDDGYEYARRYARADRAQPTLMEHWAISEMPGGVSYNGMLAIDGKPALSGSSRDDRELYLVVGANADPTTDEWVTQVVNTLPVNPMGTTLFSIGDLPAIVFFDKDTDTMNLARATSATPASASDWQIHSVFTPVSADARFAPQFDVAVAGGRPVITNWYAWGDDNLIKIAWADSAVPESDGDWNVHTVLEVSESVSFRTSVGGAAGFPVIAWSDEMQDINYLSTTAADPGPSDWSSHVFVDTTASLWNGPTHLSWGDKPAFLIAFGTLDGSGLLFEYATTTTPASIDDWKGEGVASPGFDAAGRIQPLGAAIVDDQPGIAMGYSNASCFQYTYRQEIP